MAGSVNKVILIGNLGKDPDVRTTQNGTKIASFSIATSESWKDKNTGERKENTQWHRVVIFNDVLVSVAERFLKKGSKVFIEGQLESRKWTGDDGRENSTTEVVLRPYRGELTLLEKIDKDDNQQQYGSSYSRAGSSNSNQSDGNVGGHYGPDGRWVADPQAPAHMNPDIDDDIPF